MSAPSETALKQKTPGSDGQHRGVYHWMWERLTSLALIPLTLWLVCSIVSVRAASYEQFVAWLHTPFNAVLLLALIAIAYYHAVLGLQVVIDDYVASRKLNRFKIVAVKIVFTILAAISIVSIVKIAF